MSDRGTDAPRPSKRPSSKPVDGAAGGLPAGLSAPARRALAGAGIRSLADLASRSEAEVLRLHGMGPKAIRQIREAMSARGTSFAGDVR